VCSNLLSSSRSAPLPIGSVTYVSASNEVDHLCLTLAHLPSMEANSLRGGKSFV